MLVLMSVALIYSPQHNRTNRVVHTIVRTDAGFEPNKLTIALGDEVRFFNDSSGYFWPASDLHPQHAVYPAFDSRQGLPSGSSWSFTFDQAGDWRFHDHLDAVHDGTIRVYAEGVGPNACAEDLANPTCWNLLIHKTLLEEGIDATISMVAQLQSSTPAFTLVCHEYMHDIGLQAYRVYGKNVPLSMTLRLCNAGFFHGYMEGYFSGTYDIVGAIDFCTRVGRELGNSFSLAEGQCYHGIGHGITERYISEMPTAWDDMYTLSRKPLATCRIVGRTDDERHRCFSAVFNVLRAWASTAQRGRGYTDFAKNLFKTCAQEGRSAQKSACYWEFAVAMQFGTPISTVARAPDLHAFVSSVDYDEYAPWIARSWATLLGRTGVVTRNPKDLIRVCRTMEDKLQLACVSGLVEGVLFAERADDVGTRALLFCGLPDVYESERMSCYKVIQGDAASIRSAVEQKSVCTRIPEKYRDQQWCAFSSG